MKTRIFILFAFLLVSYSLSAQQEYFSLLSKPNWDYCDVIIEKTNGELVVVASSNSNNNNYDLLFVTIDSSTGAVLNEKIVGSTINEFANTLQYTSDGNYILGGSKDGHAYMMKLDTNFNVIWDNEFPNFGHWQSGISAFEHSSGKHFMIGRYGYNDYNQTFFYRVDVNGIQEIADTLNFISTNHMIESHDSLLIVAGFLEVGQYDGDIVIAKLDLDGDTIWRKQYNLGDSYSSSITKTDDGGYLLSCFHEQILDVGYQILLMKIDESGDTLWTKKMPFAGIPSHIINVDDGFVLSSAFYNVWDQKHYLDIYHLDDSANVQCVNRTYGGWHERTSSNIIASSNGSTYLTGGYKIANKPDIFVAKVDTNCNLIVNYTSTHDYLLKHNIKLFPNPTQGSFQLDNLPEKAVIEIYDQLGRIIKSFENQNISLQLDISNYTNGIYFVKIQHKDLVQTIKLIKY